ncbi:EF-hand domain-containing protein [Pelagicoccus sp. SDUM812005]|uniref:EF-hand domain-containing protein n=1 Tax=Pelagicoccus sp. SDUM812005 TaxID=3041257 RepID=UPI00280D9279|nr:EF-hand domain-containing protein [Pelagicoccus sp. SDUM812005]MDQ8179573.1 EF-hand domain-containing protein [Pelagicoccus sp. SDUM812005]
MKHLLLACLMLASSLSSASAATPSPRGSQSGVGPNGVLRSGQIPDLDAYTATGEAIKLRELLDGKYTVLTSGCLTCPQFHDTYPEIEAAFADYSTEGVQFYYFYKSLRHPELQGYVEAQNIQERLLQLAELKEKLATQVPWIADTIDDSLRIGLGANSQSVYLISPQGEIFYANARIVRNELRAALNKAVGKPSQTTLAHDLDLPTLGRNPRLLNEDTELGVKRPEGLTIVAIAPAKPEETYYVKLRAEADDALLKTGTGKLFLGFYPDPIHDAHWNNLTPPMQYTLTLPEGVKASPAQAKAKQGPGDSDTLPRQFWVDIEADSPPEAITLTLDYYGCTPDMCMALTHEYTIRLEDQNRGARTYSMNRGNRGNARAGNSQERGNQAVGPRGMNFSQMDSDQDGFVSIEEMVTATKKQRGEDVELSRIQRRFERIDSDGNGKLSEKELEAAPRPNAAQRGGNR